MEAFTYHGDELYAEAIPLSSLAQHYGTPCYVYSRAAIEAAYRAYEEGFGDHPHLICYAVKANSNIAVLNILARLGAGFDIVSGGELERVLAAGGSPDKVIFSGVGKTAAEMRRALQVGIHCFNVESAQELERLNQVAADLGLKASISLRVNPDVDAETHPYISTGLKDNKFGIDIKQALDIYRTAARMSHINIVGVDCHIGSQLTSTAPFTDALDRVLALVDALQGDGITIRHLDLGGGLGVVYQDETPPSPAEYLQAVLQGLQDRKIALIIEPGRSIVANAGVMLTKVEYLKEGEDKNFAVIDAAMNDLIRPALYQSWMDIVPVRLGSTAPGKRYDVVGPVCESGDFLGKDRELSLTQDDLLAVKSAGAYCFTMSSNYNTRNRAAEVMVDGERHHLIRRRESYNDQISLENLVQE